MSEYDLKIRIRSDLRSNLLAIFEHAAETKWDNTTTEIIEKMIENLKKPPGVAAPEGGGD